MVSVPVEVSFGRSTSPNHATAVRLAESLPGYQTTGEGKHQVHTVSFQLSLDDDALWQRLQKLMEVISAWQSSSLCVAGQLHSYWQIQRKLGVVQSCYATKIAQERGDHYCSGAEAPDEERTSFGCRLLEGVSRHLHGYHTPKFRWYQFGHVADDHRFFLVDRDAVFQEIRKSSAHSYCEFCPCFSWDRVREDVDSLPERIDTQTSETFELRYSEINPDKPLGVRPKKDDRAFSTTISLVPCYSASFALRWHRSWPTSRRLHRSRGSLSCHRSVWSS